MMRGKIYFKTAAALLTAAAMAASMPGNMGYSHAAGERTEQAEAVSEKGQIRGINVLRAAGSGGVSAVSMPAPVAQTDPMYWMGQRSGGDTNRAMVWFGKYWQGTGTGANNKSPILWRTLRSDGQGNYGGGVTLFSEYVLNTMTYDGKGQQHWCSADAVNSCDIRAYLNGYSTGAMNPNVVSQNTDSGLKYNSSGGGAGNIKGSFYANAFNQSEKSVIVPTALPGELGGSSITGSSVSDKIFALSGFRGSTLQSYDVSNSAYFKNANDLKAFSTNFAATTDTISGSASSAGTWWLRTPCQHNTFSNGFIYGSSGVLENNSSNISPDWGARPALNLSPDQIVFTTASNTGGAPKILEDTAATTATKITTNKLYETDGTSPASFSTEYPSTSDYASGQTSFRVFERTGEASPIKIFRNKNTCRIWYKDIPQGDFIQVLLVDTSNGKKWSGRVKEIKAEDIPAAKPGETPGGARGIIRFTLPLNIGNGGASENVSKYRIFAWTEREGSSTALGTADKSVTDTLDKLPVGEGPVITVDTGNEDKKDNVGKWAGNKAVVQLDFHKDWKDAEKQTFTMQYRTDNSSVWKDYTYNYSDPLKSQKLEFTEEGNNMLYTRCVLKNGADEDEMSEISYKIVRVDKTVPDISTFKKKTIKDTKDNNKIKVQLSFKVKDMPDKAADGVVPSEEEELEEVDGIYNSGIQGVYYSEVDLVKLKKEKEDAKTELTKDDLDQLVTDNKARKLTALKTAEGKDPDIHGTLSYELLFENEASQNAGFAAAVDEAGLIYVTKVYDGEKLLDVTAPAKMMFAGVTTLSDEGKLQAPDYVIRNNSDLSEVEVSLNFEAQESGDLKLSKQEKPAGKDELALFIRKPRGTYTNNPFENKLKGQPLGERQFGLLSTASGDSASSTVLGTLEKKPADPLADAETAGCIGWFTFEAGMFPYQRKGLHLDRNYYGVFKAQFHFEVTVTDEVDAVRKTPTDSPPAPPDTN